MKQARLILASMLIMLVLTGCSEVRLYSNLPEHEINQMVAILQTQGIESTKLEGDEGKWHITVVKESYADAVAILEEAGHPGRSHPTIQDLFPKTGFTSSPAEQKIRLNYGIAESIASTIEALPGGIIRADVHLAPKDNQPFREDTEPARANVVVTYRKGADMEFAAATIPQIVMGAVDGLTADDVGVELIEAEDTLLSERIKMSNRPETEKLTNIFSISVTKASAPKLIAVLVVGGVALVLLLFLAVQKLFLRRAA